MEARVEMLGELIPPKLLVKILIPEKIVFSCALVRQHYYPTAPPQHNHNTLINDFQNVASMISVDNDVVGLSVLR